MKTSLYLALADHFRSPDEGHTLGTAQKRMLINIILTFTYIGVPMLWLFTMNIAGLKAGHGAGTLLSSSSSPMTGVGQVAGQAGSKAGQIASTAAGGVKGAATKSIAKGASAAKKYRF